nr:RHS repeat-associated core domain-containing protein [uncultured Flavobacterium sp.]
MKKIIVKIALLLAVLCSGQLVANVSPVTVHYNLDTYGAYPNYSQSLLLSDFVNTGSGGGNGNVSITNNVLTVSFSGSWSPKKMKLGVLKQLNVSPSLPDIDLGPLKTSAGTPIGLSLKIENNALVAYSSFFMNGVSCLLQTSLASSASVNVSFSNLYVCDTNGGSGGSGGSFKLEGGLATLSFSGGWSENCTLKTGQIAALGVTVPNTELGVIYSNGIATDYNAKIESNYLVFYVPGTVYPTPSSVNFSYSDANLLSIEGGDANKNWTLSTSYDTKGNKVAAGIAYFDDLGKSDVSLSKDFLNNKVWGTETIYDEQGRPFRTSFVAPSTLNSFEKTNFLRAYGTTGSGSVPQQVPISTPITSSQNVRASQLITASSTIAASTTVNFTAPQIILTTNFSAGPGFTATAAAVNEDVAQPNLYQYYSDANTLEPYQATATHPFSEVMYDELNPGNTVKVIGGNEINGDWKTGFSYTLPAAQEMYYAFGAAYFDGDIQSQGEVVVTKFFKTVVQDANGVENVSFSDGEGKVLASGTSGRGSAYPVVSLIGTQGFIDIHIPLGVSPAALIGSASDYKIYNLKTGALHTGSLLGGNFYRIEAVVVPTAEPVAYITSGGGVTYSAGAKGVTYTVNYADFALNYYDKTGRLSKTIQPKGYQNNTSILATPTHTLVTTYTYDTLGQVTMVTSPDEGTSRFAYRKDGQIRYSQSALQNDTKVSYTDYDSLGRPIESGVITGSVGIWTLAMANPDGTLLNGTRSEQMFTIYDDYKDFTTSYAVPANLDLAALLTSRGLNAAQYIPNNLSGNVAVTFNDSSFTWYSYDLYGRLEWMVQNVIGLGLKTVHYYYDHNGNVKKVIYQKDVASEMFVHQYTYQVNGALLTVATSVDNVTFKEHAKYKYYQTGELKRVELAQGLQGIDYVYTLGGALKSINHPSLEAANDPGRDTNDVFGVTLDYYSGDYLRSNTNITTSPSVTGLNQDNYDGNIKASRWANRQKDVPNPLAAASATNTAQQRGYMYNYNPNKWLTGASFGNVSGNAISPATAFKEGNITYDKNGNILSLQRAKEDGTVIDNFTYNYGNGNNQLTHVDDAVVGNADIQDLKDQNTNNYGYDVLGRMTGNLAEGLTYTYNTQGLVTQIKKGTQLTVNLKYNERGHRVSKEVITNNGTGSITTDTEYNVLDLSGNVMGVYFKRTGTVERPITLYQKENSIFGASRLGVYTRAVGLKPNVIPAKTSYEITDHLGNVRAVIQENPNLFSILLSYADYYAFGEQLPSRNTTSDYRYAFQGQELDIETNMEAFQLRLWDGRIGRWLSPDPYGEFDSPYLGMGNNPISLIDPDGGQTIDPPVKPTELREVIIQGRPKSSNFKLDMSFNRNMNGLNFSFDDSWKKNINFKAPLTTTTPNNNNNNNTFKHNWNVDKAVETLNNNALTSSSGYCAKYVRYALEAGGVNTNGRPGSAKDYDTFLLKKGFNKVSSLNYKPITGDIVVMEAFVGLKKNHPHGHIQMYNGNKWISDFVQKDFWPGSDFRNAQPITTILRK